MDLQELLKFADELVFAESGQHLDDIQEIILRGVWKEKKYYHMAEESHHTEGHLRNVASELWQIISSALGENVNKSNLLSRLTRYQQSNFSGSRNFHSYNNINICRDNPYSKPTDTSSQKESINQTIKPQQKKIDLTDAPNITNFYPRPTELAQLQHAISHPNTRIITITGLSGIGKTALTLQVIPDIRSRFDYIIYRSLNSTPTLSSLQTDLIPLLCAENKTESASIFNILRSHPILLILDDVHHLFTPGKFAGNYLPRYEDYSTFFRQIATSSHQSCLILMGWEKPNEIIAWEGENQPCQSLHIKGLGESATELLRQKGLTDEDKWLQLIELYQGHPLWLNIIVNMIQDLFNSSVAKFLDFNTRYIKDLEPLLNQHFARLSPLEKLVIFGLVNQDECVDISQVPADLSLSTDDFLSAIPSLRRRGWLEKRDRAFFTIPPVLREYLQRNRVYEVGDSN